MGILISKFCFTFTFSFLLLSLLPTSGQIGIDQAEEPFFTVTILTPDESIYPSRVNWTKMIAEEWVKIGVETKLELVDWDGFDNRSWAYGARDEVGIPIHDEGGYDIWSVGVRYIGHDFLFWDVVLATSSINDKVGFDNTYQYSDPSIDTLYAEAESLILDSDYDRKLEIVAEVQDILYEEVPTMEIFSHAYFLLTNKNFELGDEAKEGLVQGWRDNLWQNVLPQNNKLVFATASGLDELPISPFETDISYWRFGNPLVQSMVWQGLLHRDSLDNYRWKPLLANALPIWNTNYTQATITLGNATFADGHELNATDVVESYRLILTPRVNSWSYGNLQHDGYIGPEVDILDSNDSIIAIDDKTVQFNFNSSMKEYTERNHIFTVNVVPTHIYGTVLNPLVTNYDYTAALFNDTSTYGIGTGPYIIDDLDIANQKVVLNKNPNYWNGDVATPTIEIVKEADSEIATDKLNDNTYQMLDIGFQHFISARDVENKTNIDTHLTRFRGYAPMQLGVNHVHPILGTGVDTPLGKENPARALEAAKYVRQALNHALPREAIVKAHFTGWGIFGTTSVHYGSVGYDYTTQNYEFDLELSRELLRKAGYGVTSSQTSNSTESGTNGNDGFFDNTLNTSVAIGVGAAAGILVIYQVLRSRPKT